MNANLPMRSLRLALARALAWALLLTGWLGIGSFALRHAPSLAYGFALTALWLLALGAAAAVPGAGVRPWGRLLAMVLAAGMAGVGLWAMSRGGGLRFLFLTLLGWAALTALASGVVRSLRLTQVLAPGPPIVAASLGALLAGLVLGDLDDLSSLASRLVLFVAAAAVLLLLLQGRQQATVAVRRCRAGLFDCSLPAWPKGAWRDALQWPTLLAGLAMLPMMAAMPLMAGWCRDFSMAPQTMVLLHLGAMFGPALLLRSTLASWSLRRLSTVCAALLVTGVVCMLWAPAPYDFLGLAVTHGAAWGLAWGGQLWAPARRGSQAASPLAAAAGYALLTLVFGLLVEQLGANGLSIVHAVLGMAAALAWLFATVSKAWPFGMASETDVSSVSASARPGPGR